MISSLLYALERGVAYVKSHPQILFALFLVIILPLAFLYSGNQFLEAGQANQDRLQKDKVGILHDSFVAILKATDYDVTKVQPEIERVSLENPDLTKFRIAKSMSGVNEIVVIAANDLQAINAVEIDSVDLYRLALIRPDESMITPFYIGQDRFWQSFRAVTRDNGEVFYIFTETDLHAVDQLLASRKQTAYVTLAVLYVFLLLLAFWLIKLTNYQYLYLEVKKANEIKDLFTNMIAHELRAPLTAIRGYGSLMKESTQNPDQIKYSERIILSSERLLNIVNDLLDVARIQSGKLKVTKETMDVSAVAVAVTEELQVSAKEKNITLVCTGVNNPVDLESDAKRLQQILTNLVSNAIKYTKEGTITLVVNQKPQTVELRVQDTGMGISASDQKKLFAPFFRVQSDDVSQITGTGLGMWITRQMVELLGGKIGVESIKGVGTHVVVTIPRQVK